jgi:hypothetical protein
MVADADDLLDGHVGLPTGDTAPHLADRVAFILVVGRWPDAARPSARPQRARSARRRCST